MNELKNVDHGDTGFTVEFIAIERAVVASFILIWLGLAYWKLFWVAWAF